MNGYGFWAVVVQSIASLAWPIAVFASVWIFRARLSEAAHSTEKQFTYDEAVRYRELADRAIEQIRAEMPLGFA